MRAPGPVTVRSMTCSSDPFRSPDNVFCTSRDLRVAKSTPKTDSGENVRISQIFSLTKRM